MKRLFITSITLLMLHTPVAYGQMRYKTRKLLTIGFNTQVSKPDRKQLLKSYPCNSCYTNGLYLRRYINRNLSIESGINFTTDHFATPILRVLPAYFTLRTQPSSTMVSLSAQYYSPYIAKKVRTFAGLGCYYSINSSMAPKITKTNTTDVNHNTTVHKNRFVPFYISQGFSFDVSTRIEINESIHFTPKDENNCTQVGLTIGLGYKL